VLVSLVLAPEIYPNSEPDLDPDNPEIVADNNPPDFVPEELPKNNPDSPIKTKPKPIRNFKPIIFFLYPKEMILMYCNLSIFFF
jgi:hypothetical protein